MAITTGNSNVWRSLNMEPGLLESEREERKEAKPVT